jgi:hypothetical protein
MGRLKTATLSGWAAWHCAIEPLPGPEVREDGTFKLSRGKVTKSWLMGKHVKVSGLIL